MGKYVNDNLGAGEVVLFETHLNYALLLGVMFLFVPLALVLFPYFFYALLVIIPLLSLFYYLSVRTSEFVVTNRKVFIKYGILSVISSEINLDRIESIIVHQDIIGRMCGYGGITVSGTGGSKQVFNFIDNPIEFRKKVSEAIDRHNDKK